MVYDGVFLFERNYIFQGNMWCPSFWEMCFSLPFYWFFGVRTALRCEKPQELDNASIFTECAQDCATASSVASGWWWPRNSNIDLGGEQNTRLVGGNVLLKQNADVVSNGRRFSTDVVSKVLLFMKTDRFILVSCPNAKVGYDMIFWKDGLTYWDDGQFLFDVLNCRGFIDCRRQWCP